MLLRLRTSRRCNLASSRLPVAICSIVTVCVALLASHVSAQEKSPTPKPVPQDAFKKTIVPFFNKYCVECHGKDEPEGEFSLTGLMDEASIYSSHKSWEKVFGMLELGAMPPEDADPKPGDAENDKIVAYLDTLVFTVDCNAVRDPGRVTVRRLNRTEYNNTVRDLLGVDFRPADDFPSDDVGYGFDNIGDVLTISPLLLEKYLDAAEAVAERAIAVPPKPEKRKFSGTQLQRTGSATLSGSGAYGLNSSGSVYKYYRFETPGDYILRARAGGKSAAGEDAKMEVRLDEKTLKVFDVKPPQQAMNVYEIKVHVDSDTKKFEAVFINDYYNPEKGEDRNLAIASLEIEGPLDAPFVDLPESHKRLMIAHPGKNKDVSAALASARKVLEPFIGRAFRRPATKDEVDRFTSLVKIASEQGDGYEEALRVAVSGVLVSPHFLFRVEQDQKPDDPKALRSLNDYELASRLSYFLWSTMPDEELLTLAGQFKLHDDKVLEAQVQRMLKDPRSQALVDNFAAQWLNLRSLAEVTPDRKQFPTFDEKLQADMRRETEMFFEAVMREDRNMLDLLDGKFTFLNERLAKHYGISGVQGEEFRQVELTGNQRAGVLTHASILTITSNPTRTSPVKRGKWILENILGTPPPIPPDDVPLLAESQSAKPDATLREQLELHREIPGCRACHESLDSIGFGFENFDAVGRWRDREGKNPVDASGVLPSGEKFAGPLELVQVLKKKQSDVSRNIVEKMLTYALGRGLEYYDQCAVDSIVRAHAKAEFRFSALVLQIVKCDPFLKRRGDGE